MNKTYLIKTLNGYTTTVVDNEQPRIISFHKNSTGGCEYTTDNEDIQASIEADGLFGKIITLAKVEGETNIETKEEVAEEPELFPDGAAEETETKIYHDVTRRAEAIDVLAELGIDASSIRKKADIVAMAEKAGVSFPNLK